MLLMISADLVAAALIQFLFSLFGMLFEGQFRGGWAFLFWFIVCFFSLFCLNACFFGIKLGVLGSRDFALLLVLAPPLFSL